MSNIFVYVIVFSFFVSKEQLVLVIVASVFLFIAVSLIVIAYNDVVSKHLTVRFISLLMLIRSNFMSLFANLPSVNVFHFFTPPWEKLPRGLQTVLLWKYPNLAYDIPELKVSESESGICNNINNIAVFGVEKSFCYNDSTDLTVFDGGQFHGFGVFFKSFEELVELCGLSVNIGREGDPLLFLEDRNPMPCGFVRVDDGGERVTAGLVARYLAFRREQGGFTIPLHKVKFCLPINCGSGSGVNVCIPLFESEEDANSFLKKSGQNLDGCGDSDFVNALNTGFSSVFVLYHDDNSREGSSRDNPCNGFVKHSDPSVDSLIVCPFNG